MSSATDSGNGVELQPRDLAILRGLFDARVMTAEHVAAIYFGGRYEAARKRLMKLKSGGYVGQRPRRAYDPAILFLTRKAFVALIQRGAVSDLPAISWKSLEKRVRVSPLTLKHELEVQDVRSAFHLAIDPLPNLALTAFDTWPAKFQFQAFNPAGHAIWVKPDGFIRIHETGAAFEHLLFLELDRSTEPQETLVRRAHCYRDYYRRGGLAVRRGHSAAEYDQFPFRVLMVFRNGERRNNTAERLLLMHPPILTQVWLTTFVEVKANPLGSIWIRPIDFRNVIENADGSPDHHHDPIYRRSLARPPMIEEALQKKPLLQMAII